MYAVAFDMSISDLEKHYGTPYNNAYFEIATILYKYSFYRIQGSTYVTEDKNMGNLMLAVDALAYTEWFAKSVRDIRAFKIEDWSEVAPAFIAMSPSETVKIKASLYQKRQ